MLLTVLDVTQFVVGSDEVLHGDFGALFDAEIATIAEIPGRSVAHDLAVGRPFEHGRRPERVRHGFHAERDEELVGQLEHAHRVVALALQTQRDVHRLLGREGHRGVVQVRPALRPHVAQQMGWDWPVERHQLPVLLVQLLADVGVQLDVQRTETRPNLFELGVEVLDVVRSAPLVAEVFEAWN